MFCTLTSRRRSVEMKGEKKRERAGCNMVDSRSSHNRLFRDGDQPELKEACRLNLQGHSDDSKQLRVRKWLRGSTREQRERMGEQRGSRGEQWGSR